MFNIENTAFTLANFPISYLELVSTILGLASVILMARRNILTFPIGVVASVLTVILLYQFQLYSNALEYLYYVGANFVGWYLWLNVDKTEKKLVPVKFSSINTIGIGISISIVLSILWGVLMTNIHQILPNQFPAPAAFPFVDAFTTMFAFWAMWMQVKRRIECYYIWLAVNVGYIIVYYVKGLGLYSGLSGIYLIITAFGLYFWLKESREDLPVVSE